MPSNRKLKLKPKQTVFFEVDKQVCQHCNQKLNRYRLYNLICIKCKKLETPQIKKLIDKEDKHIALLKMRAEKW